MKALIKAEFRKLLTVRSTYVILGLAFLLEVFFAFYVSGIKANQAVFDNPDYLASQAGSAITTLGLIIGLAAVMLITHEYRYNTIMYTLTSSKGRLRVLFAKFFVISVFAVIFAVVYGTLSPILAAWGAHIHGLEIVNQQFDVWQLIWRGIFVGWAFLMFVSVMAIIIRSQVGAIAAAFLLPGTVEPLLGLLLKQNQVYLPFTSLSVLLGNGEQPISPQHGALVATAYIVIGLIIAAILFVRRDAN
jgi:ABC-type transport system involved in multi-copper enzyme maturation permease subunit